VKRCMLLLLMLPGIAVADDAAIYESADDVAIGRVFLTPTERRWLDQRRNDPVAAMSQESSEQSTTSTPTRTTRPAGYIVRNGGERRRWQNGEFVRDNSSSDKFPGDVDITRHATSQRESGADDSVDDNGSED